MTPIVVYITCATDEEAAKIGRAMVTARLAACANIFPHGRSIYRWQGAIEDAMETVLILKSRQELFASLAAEVRALHSYATPCIIALPILAGTPDYLAWLAESTAGAQ